MLKTGENLKEGKIIMAKYGTKAGFDSMASSGLKLLSNDELDTLHYATLQVLKNTGIRVESRLAADLFQSGGASVPASSTPVVMRKPCAIGDRNMVSSTTLIGRVGAFSGSGSMT